jgi:sucrose phosphorylase
MARTINRERLQAHALEKELADKNSLRSQIFSGLAKLFSVRRQLPAFHPNTPQSVPMLHPSVISIVRSDPEIGKQVICLHNVSAQDVNVDLERLLKASETDASVQVIYHNNHGQNVMDNFTLKLEPFASIWLSSTVN